jgi:hypothetical protein
MKHGKKVVTGSQAGVINLFDWGKWTDYSDKFPG